MKKDELISAVAADSEVDEKTVKKVLRSTNSVTQAALASGDSVLLFGLGKLYTRRRAEKRSGNFGKPGGPVVIPAHNIAFIKASSGLSDAIN